jgi:protein-S-isoprenylcysteine O-methyltransferase Ste14
LENQPTKNLLTRLIGWGLIQQITLVILLFVPGTLRYWQGWAFSAVNFAVALIFCTYLYRCDREVLARRMLRKEKIVAQKIILFLMKEVSVVFYIVCGLDNRFGWSRNYFAPVPWWLTALALLGYAGCYFLFIPVLNANRFASSIIQIEAGQTVADTGPYRLVRHPMYAVGIVLWFWMPLALGSFTALPLVALIIPILIWRLLNEEKILRRELPGYAEYCRRTPYRLIPFVW